MKTKISQIELKKAYSYLVEHSSFDIDFIVLIVISTVICFLGFTMNSPTVIIGAMVVSPLLYTVVAIPASVFQRDKRTLWRRVLVLGFAFLVVVILSSACNYFFPIDLTSTEVAERLEDSYIIYFLVALFSGMAGTFCFYWPKLLEALTGVAISIALLPPLCILGFAISTGGGIWPSALAITLLNIFGIALGAIVVLGFLYLSRKTRQDSSGK